MNLRLAIRALSTLLVIAASGWLGHRECRAAMSLQDILGANDTATLTSGFLTYSFNKATVLSSTFPQDRAPTLATVFVSTVPSGLTFTFDPSLRVGGPTAQNFNVTLSYTVTSTASIIGAGLSFVSVVPDLADNNLSNPEASASVNEMVTNDLTLKVFRTNDQQSVQTLQNNQSASVPATMSLSITDTANVSISDRGNGATSQSELDSLTNTFFVPEPSSFALTSIATTVGLGVAWRGRRRSAAAA
jgi:hypothetical protein